MAIIGYHCSHERFAPSKLLEFIQLAEAVGFEAGMCSDHFHPWSDEQGQSGFAWSWLGAALQATELSFGMVCAPGQRYHPAIIAQAAATLAEMYPGRLWVSIGTGEYLNEHITGGGWPTKKERQARLKECADIMRALWAGETVTHRGSVTVEEAKLYTRPQQPPLILGAALSNETAEWVGSWADGLITVAKPRADQEKFIRAFRRGGGEGKPMYLQSLHGYAKDHDTALEQSWRAWRTSLLGGDVLGDLKMPALFEAAAGTARPEDITKAVRVSASLDDHIRWLKEDIELGFERIYLYNAPDDQAGFLRDFAREVLPALKSEKAAV